MFVIYTGNDKVYTYTPMETAYFIIGAGLAYLLGSIPFGFLIARSKGIDIRSAGSGNIGATNVFRVLGKKAGITTFILDFGKGIVATGLIHVLIFKTAELMSGGAYEPLSGNKTVFLRLLCAGCVVLGHSFPVFLGFKGGKGVATGAGIIVGLVPHIAGVAIGLWAVVFLLSRYVSLASIVAAIVVAAMPWVELFRKTNSPEGAEFALPCILTFLALLVILRHKANIGRLIKGNENRFSFSKTKKE